MATAPSRLIALLRPWRVSLSLGMATVLLESLLALLSPWFAGQFTALLPSIDGGARFSLHGLLLAWLLVLALLAWLRYFNGYLFHRIGARVMTELSRRLHARLLVLPRRFHEQRPSGDRLALLGNDVAVISQFIASPIASALSLGVTLLGAAAMLIWIDPLIGGLVVLVAPLFLFAVQRLSRRIRPLARRVADQRAEMLATAGESLRLLPVVKSFVQEERRRRRFRQDSEAMQRALLEQLRRQALLGPLMQFLAAAMILALLWLASARVASGDLGTPDLVSLLLYGFLLVRPVNAFAGLYGIFQQARGAFERIDEVLAETPEVDSGSYRPPARVAGGIEFERVAFGYPGRAPLFLDLNLRVAAGETVVIRGGNGAGKSTLAALLLRFERPSAGVIRLDGVALGDYRLAALRRQIGYVPQQLSIANGTIRDNIAFGCPEADDAAVRAAARMAQADAFIEALPDGYHTLVGDAGARLSGGQCQRLALARALLPDPPVLILDEPTAMLDPEGEEALLEACKAVFARRTVLIITHRPALLALATRCLVLENGVAREVGQPLSFFG